MPNGGVILCLMMTTNYLVCRSRSLHQGKQALTQCTQRSRSIGKWHRRSQYASHPTAKNRGIDAIHHPIAKANGCDATSTNSMENNLNLISKF
jgi:hypothetical protein